MKFTLSFLLIAVYFSASAQIRVLIVDGQNNHEHWPKITFMLKQYLEETGKFEVDLKRTRYTWKGEEFLEEYGLPGTEKMDKPTQDVDFSPSFKKYDVVISNFGWNAAPWTEKTQLSFEKYIKKGGGLVVIHAADNSFPKWEAYNKMIGLGGWGDRTEKDGPYVYFNDKNELIKDMSPGRAGSHGPQHEYLVQHRNTEHPITKGLPKEWLHAQDELYDRLRGPAGNMEVIATAYSAKDKKGTERHEPILMTIKYGKGRIFHSVMGHADYSVACEGFITTFLRGTEWAATNKVTLPIPSAFPSAEKSLQRAY